LIPKPTSDERWCSVKNALATALCAALGCPSAAVLIDLIAGRNRITKELISREQLSRACPMRPATEMI
jgi:hypothetical protein